MQDTLSCSRPCLENACLLAMEAVPVIAFPFLLDNYSLTRRWTAESPHRANVLEKCTKKNRGLDKSVIETNGETTKQASWKGWRWRGAPDQYGGP
eukprot:1156621-Pelagomonas_calceolata.AAC.3